MTTDELHAKRLAIAARADRIARRQRLVPVGLRISSRVRSLSGYDATRARVIDALHEEYDAIAAELVRRGAL